MEIILDESVDLFIRRAWYENTEFMTPKFYEQYILPELKKDVQMAHEAESKFAIITSAAYTPLLDYYVDSGIDVLIGLDPVQDSQVDFKRAKQKLGGKICLWGGVNGFITVEQGTDDEVRAEVKHAIEVLGPGSGFILSPVDNVRDTSAKTWRNVQVLIDAWEKYRMY